LTAKGEDRHTNEIKAYLVRAAKPLGRADREARASVKAAAKNAIQDFGNKV
jgi:hypothetical protein